MLTMVKSLGFATITCLVLAVTLLAVSAWTSYHSLDQLAQNGSPLDDAAVHNAQLIVVLTAGMAVGSIILAAVLLSRDLFARRRAASEYAQTAQYNQLLLDSTGEGIYGVDLKGNCTFLNRAGARMLGRMPEEVLGKSMHSLAHHSHADGSPYPVENCPIYQVLRTGQGGRVGDDVFWRADGSSFPVEYT